jgi:hypothetical protein
VFLTDVAGVFTRPPHEADARLIQVLGRERSPPSIPTKPFAPSANRFSELRPLCLCGRAPTVRALAVVDGAGLETICG